MAGINRALQQFVCEAYNYNKGYSNQDKPCIFLSHISIDKSHVQAIANYIMKKADIDVYLDIKDDELQNAVKEKDPKKITQLIERGISESTHAMCLISEKTVDSWWVPYELGYAKSSNKEISSLKLKGNVYLPEFLQVGEIIMGTKSLNEYLEKIVSDFNEKSYTAMRESISLESHSNKNYPLDDVLDWNQ